MKNWAVRTWNKQTIIQRSLGQITLNIYSSCLLFLFLLIELFQNLSEPLYPETPSSQWHFLKQSTALFTGLCERVCVFCYCCSQITLSDCASSQGGTRLSQVSTFTHRDSPSNRNISIHPKEETKDEEVEQMWGWRSSGSLWRVVAVRHTQEPWGGNQVVVSQSSSERWFNSLLCFSNRQT